MKIKVESVFLINGNEVTKEASKKSINIFVNKHQDAAYITLGNDVLFIITSDAAQNESFINIKEL